MITEEQQQRLDEYNERLAKMWQVFEKYPTQTVSDAISRITEQMHGDELLDGVFEE